MISPNNPTRRAMMRGYSTISPFELKDMLIRAAKETANSKGYPILNAGRGNPNWISTIPREAFFTLGQFSIEEAKLIHFEEPGLAGMPSSSGIYERFQQYMKAHADAPGMQFLDQAIRYGIEKLNFDPDSWLYELVDGIIGDQYPYPDRMLVHAEQVVYAYLCQELYDNKPLAGGAQLFAVEGATAAMCYTFDTLMANKLLEPGDKIALMVPIFTPYLEIPHLSRYQFETVYIEASDTNPDGTHNWQYPDSEIMKLKDPAIKALFCVNPGNPTSIAIHKHTVDMLVKIVHEHNPELMIIMDDVYSTFVDQFRSIMTDLPHNSIGVYSYSKYYGVTGWRLGVIAVHPDNIFDKRIQSLPAEKRADINSRYAAMSMDPESISFIDRIVADSRQVALNHTAGLSTPQQIQMTLFSLYGLLDEQHCYKELTKSICRRRKQLFYEGLVTKMVVNEQDAMYYTEFDVLVWGEFHHGSAFTDYMKANYEPIDILFRLAEESAIVLLNGSGFHAPPWSVRVSLANLDDEAYPIIGRALKKALQDYVDHWKTTIDSEKKDHKPVLV